MSITRHHNEWLRLVPNSGPFLSLPVLASAFPQGLDAHNAEHARRLRLAFDEWDDNQLSQRPDPSLHRAWIKFVFGETLGYEDLLAEGQELPQALKSDLAEYGETLRPDWIVNDPATKKPRLLIQVYPRSQSLTKPVAGRRWNAWPDGRMMQLLHDTGIRLGIVTNGDHWMLVNAPKNETTGYASWYASLWQEEPVTLRAFLTILGADRLFSVPENETLEALLEKSAADQQEVTDQLGYQVRKAVEVLIQALDKADQDHGRKLLADVDEKVLYESALTVMMRLVFLFCAEERELLLLGDELYDKNYAVSTLREQLRITADQFGEEILGLRHDAWTRLLTTFRAVYAGAKHDRLKLPAYGGNLFNPDRFPFLEGRKSGTTWRTTEATPLPVSNRTVLHLLEALQVLRTKVGNTTEARNLSFRSLDIEQIGHVYEGLLDHTAKRATEAMLGLAGTQDKEPEIALANLEKIAAKGEKELLKFLKDKTGRSESALKKGLSAELEDQLTGRFRTACQDSDLWKRVKPFAGLARLDTVGYPVVITKGSVFVTAGTDRRSSGTHYTPKSLTEPIVQYTLEPLVYIGPAEGLPKEQWKLRSARELLDLKICDMACGSGAFLVQACRYMAARLLEAWGQLERQAQSGRQQNFFHEPGENNSATVRISPYGDPSKGGLFEQVVPLDPDERQTFALRIVAQRCLYGVDKNPLAAEMAKLSLWLLTLAKDKPFEFLDHAIRCGDALVGIDGVVQLKRFNIDAGTGIELPTANVELQFMDKQIKDAVVLRRQIAEMQANTVEDIEAQDRMLREANEKIDRLKCAADMLISAEFISGSAADKRSARDDAAVKVAAHFNDGDLATFRREAQKSLGEQVTFHWPLEFPEVMIERGGFDAFVGNPPFMGGQKIAGTLSNEYRAFLVNHLANAKRGSADLCAYFFLRANQLMREGSQFGLVATNTIGQGGTREVGLDQLLAHGCTISRASASRKWPGSASVQVSHVWVYQGVWKGVFGLDDKQVSGITAFLTPLATVTGTPSRLCANTRIAFKGCTVLGMGFILHASEAERLIALDPRNRDVVFPFLNGEDINSRHDLTPSRWVINFRTMSESEAKEYKSCYDVVRELVFPYRQTLAARNDFGAARAKRWWQFDRPTEVLYQAISSLDRTLAVCVVNNHLGFAFFPTTYIYSHKVVIVARNDWPSFAILQSHIHYHWAWQYCSTLRTDINYSVSDCFDTFPFPHTRSDDLSHVARDYYGHRQATMLARQEGLTKTYNRFHDPTESNTDIQKLRELHVEMDNAVSAAYGWTDLALGHGFHEMKQGVRFTINEPSRCEVLSRLLKLNHERYAEEVKQGLHDAKMRRAAGGAQKTKKAAAASLTKSLFDNTVDTAFPSSDRDRLLCGLLCDLVSAEPGLLSTAYLDAMVIALRPKRHARLLIGKERTQFVTLAEKLPNSGQASESLPWDDMMDLLTHHETIRKEGAKSLVVGSQYADERKAYPDCDPKLIQLIHKAAATLREYQGPSKDGVTDNQEVLSAFNEDKRSLCGATK